MNHRIALRTLAIWIVLLSWISFVQPAQSQQLTIQPTGVTSVTNLVNNSRWVWEVTQVKVSLHLPETNGPAFYRVETSTDLVNWTRYCTFGYKTNAPGVIPLPEGTRQAHVATLASPILSETWTNGVRELRFLTQPHKFFRLVTSRPSI